MAVCFKTLNYVAVCSVLEYFSATGVNGVRRHESARAAPASTSKPGGGAGGGRKTGAQSVARELPASETKHLFGADGETTRGQTRERDKQLKSRDLDASDTPAQCTSRPHAHIGARMVLLMRPHCS